MPVKRRVAKQRRNTVVPAWATGLLTGERPSVGTAENDEFAGWFYFEEEVPGLPPAASPEGLRLWREAKRCQ